MEMGQHTFVDGPVERVGMRKHFDVSRRQQEGQGREDDDVTEPDQREDVGPAESAFSEFEVAGVGSADLADFRRVPSRRETQNSDRQTSPCNSSIFKKKLIANNNSTLFEGYSQ